MYILCLGVLYTHTHASEALLETDFGSFQRCRGINLLVFSSPWRPVQWEGESGNFVGGLLVCPGGESRSQAEDECSGIHYGLLALV